MSGRIQLFVQRDNLPEGFYNAEFKKYDIGDIVGATGQVFKTRIGGTQYSRQPDSIVVEIRSTFPPRSITGCPTKKHVTGNVMSI